MYVQESEQSLFPITSLDSFVQLVEEHINIHLKDGPNLAYLSVLFGYLEYELTVNRTFPCGAEADVDPTSANEQETDSDEFPTLQLEIVEGLLEQLHLTLKAQVDRSLMDFTTRGGYATQHLCKFISDVLWSGLLRTYHKDKAHIQSLFSYLTGKQLDCFGFALAVVASCQLFNYDDVHLVISGDHAWAAYGEESKDMVEVTWHGKGTEDRRGFVVDDSVMEKNWLYYNGKAVKCDRWMELAALLVSLNSSIDSNVGCEELQLIQFKLLHLLHNRGHIDRYPMALGMYCELAESLQLDIVSLTDIERLHNKALRTVCDVYDDCHVFPYCAKGHFCMRHDQHKEAVRCYAKAAQVLSKYNYAKDDEEIYKEMIDIANDLIPQALKGDSTLCDDPECYFDIISFYDGICLWEEDSSTPVLHSWWVRYFTGAISRFSPEVRERFRDDSTESSRSPPEVSHSPNKIALDGNDVSDHDRHPVTKLRLRSHKMIAMKDSLTSAKKLSSQSVGLLLTAQSEVHVIKRRRSKGDYSMEYTGNKRKRRSKESDS